MKIRTLLALATLSGASYVYAGNTDCKMPPDPSCDMQPNGQNSRDKLVWQGPLCCLPGDNVKADVSTQNTRYSLTNPTKPGYVWGESKITYSKKGGSVKEGKVSNQ